jgi:hypothetical protein
LISGTPGLVVSLAIGSPWGYLTALFTLGAVVWSIRRAFRIRLVVSAESVIVDNYWRSYEIPWSDIEGIGIALKQQGVLPQPSLAIRRRTGDPVFAKATPFRETDRRSFQTAVLALAPRRVEALPDTARRLRIGSDKALTNRIRLKWIATGPHSKGYLMSLIASGTLGLVGVLIGASLLVGALKTHASPWRYAAAFMFLLGGLLSCGGFGVLVARLARVDNS